MTTMINRFINRLKKISVVQNGLEAAQIAVETFQLVRKDYEAESKSETPAFIEDLYLKAAGNVTGVDEDKLKNRLTYKAVATVGKNSRRVKRLAMGGLKAVNDSTAGVRSLLESAFALTGIKGVDLRTAVNGVINRVGKVVSSLRKAVKDRTDALLSGVFGCCGDSLARVRDYVLAFDTAKALKARFENLRKSVRNVWDYVYDTTHRNYESAVEQKDIVKQTVVNSFKNNWGLVQLAYSSNRDLLLHFFKHYDLEVFYAPDKSLKLVNMFKNIAASLLPDSRGANATDANNADQAQESDGEKDENKEELKEGERKDSNEDPNLNLPIVAMRQKKKKRHH